MENENLDTSTDLAFEAQMKIELDSMNKGTPLAETTVPPAEVQTVDTTATENATSQALPNEAKAEGSETAEPTIQYEFKEPIQAPGESDAIYEIRKDIAYKIKDRETASSQQEKENVSEEIKSLRQELRQVGNAERFNRSQSFNNQNDTSTESFSTNDIRTQTQQILNEELAKREVTQTLNSFVEKIPQLADANTREVFFDFVESNFNWQGKTGRELNQVLEMASQVMFRKQASLEERVLKSANVQEKVNAMQFPGGTVSRQGFSADKEQSIENLKSQGLSEEQALQLLTE